MTSRTHKSIPLIAVLVLACACAIAQYKSDATYGVKTGENLSKITELPKTLISEGYYSGSNFTEDFRPSSSTSIFGEADNMLNSFGMLVGWGLPMDNQTSTGADENCQRRMFFGVN